MGRIAFGANRYHLGRHGSGNTRNLAAGLFDSLSTSLGLDKFPEPLRREGTPFTLFINYAGGILKLTSSYALHNISNSFGGKPLSL